MRRRWAGCWALAWRVGPALVCLVAAVHAMDDPLTPVGAQRAGNAAGTIPPWTGGITRPPAAYRPGEPEIDPYFEDQPLFEISAANLERHRAFLSPGQQALLETYPDTWRLRVYPTRRSASYPAFVYEALEQNRTSAGLVTAGRGGVTGAVITSPFPEPTLGVEVVWNHNLRWRGVRVRRVEGSAAVTRRGRYSVVVQLQDFGFPYGASSATAFKREYPNVMLAIKSKTIAPSAVAGNGNLVWEPINQTDDPRKSWAYFKDLRRVVRRPYFGYELPAPNSDGLRTVDDFGLFNGPPDRFDWALLGKREMYIPYNAYRLHVAPEPSDIVRTGHINPQLARYELHRVWVVEGTLKPGQRHVYARRVFYVDEDSWQIAVADSYDREGRLIRVNEAHALNYYTVPVLWSTLEVFHAPAEGRVLVNGLDNGQRPYVFSASGDPREFSPNALNYYIR